MIQPFPGRRSPDGYNDPETVKSRAFLLIVAGAAACSRSGGSDDGPTSVLISPASYPATVMDLGNASGADDDPSLIRALDGRYYLAFISDRSGNMDLWITDSADGATWSAPVQVTTSPDEDLYPNLLQTADGAFHLVWHRFEALTTGQSHIWHRTTTQPLDWGTTETPVTTGVVDDWDCKLIPVGASELRVYFSSAERSSNPTYNRDLYVVRSTDLGQTWGAPEISNASHVSQSDRYPAVVEIAPGQFRMIFQRQDTDALLDATSDLHVAESADGLAWSSPAAITSDPSDAVPDVFANFYRAPLLDRWVMSWTSPAGLISRPVGGVTEVPLSSILGRGGWSTRTAAARDGWSLLVFVSNDTGPARLYSVVLPL